LLPQDGGGSTMSTMTTKRLPPMSCATL